MRSLPNVTSFNAGEWSRLLYGQVGLAKYPNACRRMENMLATVQGPAKRRGGTRFVGFQKNSNERAWLTAFRFSKTQAFMLEMGPSYVRFCTNRAQLLLSGLPYEVVSPYTAAELTTADGTFGLTIEQAGDVLYVAGGARFPQKITRLAGTDWTIAEHITRFGPLQDQNANKDLRLSVSAPEGTAVQVVATAAVFTSQHVGMLLRIDLENINIKPWEPEKETVGGERRRSDGKTYLAQPVIPGEARTVTGTQLPIHESGIVFDGSGGRIEDDNSSTLIGVGWLYEDPGYGVGRITGYLSPTEVIVETQSPFPFDLQAQPSNRWQFGAFGAAAEYPQYVARYKNRLTYASARKVHLSVPRSYDDFSRDILGEIRDDAGITRELDSTDGLAWIRAASALLLGTESAELIAQKQTDAEPLSPSNFDADPRSEFGSRRLRPEAIGAGVVAVDGSGRRIRLIQYTNETGAYDAPDITVLCEHITRSGVVDWAFQKQPDRVLWLVLGNGALVALTIEREQEVLAGHRHPTDGKVMAVEVLPSPDGTRDDVWLIVERVLQNLPVRCIEVMDKGRDDGDPLEESFFVDCGLTYRGAPATVISGLTHLIGRQVSILADGGASTQTVDSEGRITLANPASIVHVGLPMRALLEPMTVTPGSVPGKAEIVHTVQMLLHETVGGKVGPSEAKLRPIRGRNPSTPDGAAQPLFSDWVEVQIEAGPSRRAPLVLVQDEPLPFTVCAICPEVEKNARP